MTWKCQFKSRASRAAKIILRIVVGSIFIYAGIVKVLEWSETLSAISDYQLLPPGLTVLFAVVIPWVEIFVGACIVTRAAISGASMIATILLVIFLAAQISALWRGLNIGCGCFGVGDTADLISYSTIIRTAVLIGMTLIVAITDNLSSPCDTAGRNVAC